MRAIPDTPEPPRNKRIKGNTSEDPGRTLYTHDANTAMIQVCRIGRNPTTRILGRVHGVSIRVLHERLIREDFELVPIGSEEMVADIHTKAYPENRAGALQCVRVHTGIIAPDEIK